MVLHLYVLKHWSHWKTNLHRVYLPHYRREDVEIFVEKTFKFSKEQFLERGLEASFARFQSIWRITIYPVDTCLTQFKFPLSNSEWMGGASSTSPSSSSSPSSYHHQRQQHIHKIVFESQSWTKCENDKSNRFLIVPAIALDFKILWKSYPGLPNAQSRYQIISRPLHGSDVWIFAIFTKW